MMELRYLEEGEKGRSRKLWEAVFPEDTPEFLDYYYTHKTADNQIMVLEEDGEIHAMLQQNPYKLWCSGHEITADYIIAVATDPAYRHRGYMRRLLEHMMGEMYRRKDPFTFLMPAAEAIYTPFDFQFVYKQLQGRLKPADSGQHRFSYRELTEENCEELARFSNRHLQRYYDLYAVRDKAYYQKRIHEQHSENGAVILIYEETELVGYFFYAEGLHIEVYEPILNSKSEAEISEAVKGYFADTDKEIRLAGLEARDQEPDDVEAVPTIMLRIIHLETFLSCFRAEEAVTFTLSVEDQFLAGNNGTFEITVDEHGSQTRKLSDEMQAEVIPIRILAGILTGYLDPPACLDRKITEKLDKIRKIDKIFLNEIV